jgi:alpha-tubulin suppressor-like RCC1 family protein
VRGNAAWSIVTAGTFAAMLLAFPGAASAGSARPAHALATGAPLWNHVAAGAYHTCGIQLGNTLWCWGYNYYGQLGIGHGGWLNQPGEVAGPAAGWTSVMAGGFHSCATRKDGSLWCWGRNDSGQLGIGSWADQNRPEKVTSPAPAGWASVTGGAFHTCAIRTDSTLWCWGSSESGQLGLGNTTDQDLPQQVTTPAPAGWTSVTAGDDHTCATRTDSTLWCWGFDDAGQLGIGSKAQQDLPQQVTTPAPAGWTSVAAGGDHTCALRTHALWCWGFNRYGQLGIGSTTNQARPRRVALPAKTGWSLVTLGATHTCAKHTGHILWCWGYNYYGQLGIGNSVNQDLPQQITS